MKKHNIAIVIGLTTLLSLFYFFQPTIAPAVTFKLTQGHSIELEHLKGKPVLINFWATTCSICREEMPDLKKLYTEFNHQGLEMIGVAIYYDPPNEVLKFLENHNIPYPIALDVDKALSKAFRNIHLTPTTVLISPEGFVVDKVTGRFSFETMRKKIQNMLDNETTS